MEENKQQRIDNLFHQAKQQPVKTSFENTKNNFLEASASLENSGNAAKGLKTSHLKWFLGSACGVLLSISPFLFKDTETIEVFPKEIHPIEEIPVVQQSASEMENKMPLEHMERISSISAAFFQMDTLKKPKKSTFKPQDNAWFLKNQEVLSPNESETVDAYRFPKLTEEEWRAHQKQKIKFFGKVKKRKTTTTSRKAFYMQDPYGYLFLPMGSYTRKNTTHSVPALYMKQTEVTNLEYRTFLFDLLRQNRKADFLLAKPNQSLWKTEFSYSYLDYMQENYFSHPAYNNYPVVGISRKGAEMYCEWFSEESNKRIGRSVCSFRLPTKYEWEWAAKGGLYENPFPWSGPFLRNSKGKFLANFKPLRSRLDTGSKWKTPYDSLKNQYNYIADGGFTPVITTFYSPNDYGLFCMAGNVAEMVSNGNGKFGTKGGSWNSVSQELQIIDGNDRFDGLKKPSTEVGFRPVMTYLSSPDEIEILNFSPPGVKKIRDNFYMDEGEVTNFAWLEYLNWQEKHFGKDSKEYQSFLPDSAIWNFSTIYLKHPAYRDYPVVGVSYDQAVAYCQWRTDRVKEFYAIQKEKKKLNIPKNFVYRLPTKKEWEEVARIGYSEKTQRKIETKYKGQKTSNLKSFNQNSVSTDSTTVTDITAPTLSYWPNEKGIYNLIGNVAEMVAEEGIAKGGSYIHTEEESTVGKAISYAKPKKWLGFRCVFSTLPSQ